MLPLRTALRLRMIRGPGYVLGSQRCAKRLKQLPVRRSIISVDTVRSVELVYQ